uniref:Ig-like domain-containing protein n=1 Tax=Amphilophus citrinellus TaxID=61819 RepID=A0A3Q0TAC3_AMPCI
MEVVVVVVVVVGLNLALPHGRNSEKSPCFGLSSGATIPANTKHGPRFEVFRNGTFVIKNIQLQDRGQYLCTAQNRFGSDRMVITLAVQTEAPKIQPPKSTEIAVYLGKSVTLDCLASGKPPAQTSWILPDKTFVRDAGTLYTILSPMSLKGAYKCIASNAAGADTITYHLHVAALPPSISEGAMDSVIIPPVTAKLGEPAKLSCEATGEPTPRIIWISPRTDVIPASSDKFQIMDGGILAIKKVTLASEGIYTCVARNSAGDDVKNIKVEAEPQEPFINGMKGKSTTKVLGVSYQTAHLLQNFTSLNNSLLPQDSMLFTFCTPSAYCLFVYFWQNYH